MVADMGGQCRQEYNPCPHTQLEAEVLKLLKPSPLERLAAKKVARSIVNLVRRVIEDVGIEAEITVEGSYAKDTWLAGDLDIDIFVLMPKNICLQVIEEGELLARLRSKLSSYYPVEERYAQHPYLRLLAAGVWVEVVLGCKIDWGEKPLTAVDRTPLHRLFVTSRMKPYQRDEVRLLKAFMKAVGVYGAEMAVQGFSGYLVELLVLHYGCFRSVLEEAAYRWKPPVVIDFGVDSARTLASRYASKPLVVVDPVDPGRNAAAAVSWRSFATFILAARTYLERPHRLFFFEPEPPEPGEVELRRAKLVILKAKPPSPQPPDVLWGIARRAARNAAQLLNRLGFNALDYSVYVDEADGSMYIVLEVEHDVLPEHELHRGPPTWVKDHASRFVRLHYSDPAGPWVGDDGSLYSIRPRRVRRASEALMNRLSEWLPGSMRGFSIEILDPNSAISTASRSLWRWLYQFLVKAPHWLRPELYRVGR
jgi:tRNA nucleotidyltransferase (CCA-adding enzyme)